MAIEELDALSIDDGWAETKRKFLGFGQRTALRAVRLELLDFEPNRLTSGASGTLGVVVETTATAETALHQLVELLRGHLPHGDVQRHLRRLIGQVVAFRSISRKRKEEWEHQG